MPKNKSGGIDGIYLRSLKPAIEIVVPSIAQLINLSAETAEVAVVWKTAVISPIVENGPKDDIGNYRSISVLPWLSRTLERAVCYQVIKYLESNSLINKNFSGFRRCHSTSTALIKITFDTTTNCL